MKTGAICGTEYRKQENCCHPWNRVPKTCKLVSSVEQSTENTKTGAIGGAEHRKHENWCHQCVPLMTPVFMFSVFCSTDVISFHVFGTVLH
jgi:hypothetical protein